MSAPAAAATKRRPRRIWRWLRRLLVAAVVARLLLWLALQLVQRIALALAPVLFLLALGLLLSCAPTLNALQLAEEAIEAGAQDLEIDEEEGSVTFYTDPGEVDRVRLGKRDVSELLGQERYRTERPLRGRGVVTGLAWTANGGATLAIESSKVHTLNRGFQLTGQLGDVMKESAEIAYSYVVSHLRDFGGDEDFFDMSMVHLHVPEGATPKDGPSAGITMATALMSLARRERISRPLAHDPRTHPNRQGAARGRYPRKNHCRAPCTDPGGPATP